MRVTWTIRPDDLGSELARIPQAAARAAFEALSCTGMVEAARGFCPVDSGALRESIRAERRGSLATSIIAGGGGVVNSRNGREVDYAFQVHEGTSRAPARPFLLQGVLAEARSFALEVISQTVEAL